MPNVAAIVQILGEFCIEAVKAGFSAKDLALLIRARSAVPDDSRLLHAERGLQA
jgi:hypothetical protein